MGKGFDKISTVILKFASEIRNPSTDYKLLGEMFYQNRIDSGQVKQYIDMVMSNPDEPVPNKIKIFKGIKTEAKEHRDHEIFQYASKAIEKLRPVDAQT